MIKFIVYVLLGCSLSCLIACKHHSFFFQPKPVLSVCQQSCELRAAACNKTCRNNCQQCRAYAKQKTAKSYYRYQHEQYVKGAILALELNSFRDPLQCRKVTCNCRVDYQVCLRACK